MNCAIFTLWATLSEEEGGPWMIAAEDEFSWEGDPKRCEEVFADARKLAERNGWEVREIVLRVPLESVDAAFSPAEIAVSASPVPGETT